MNSTSLCYHYVLCFLKDVATHALSVLNCFSPLEFFRLTYFLFLHVIACKMTGGHRILSALLIGWI